MISCIDEVSDFQKCALQLKYPHWTMDHPTGNNRHRGKVPLPDLYGRVDYHLRRCHGHPIHQCWIAIIKLLKIFSQLCQLSH